MDRNKTAGEKESISPHSLIAEDSTGGRRRAGRFYLAAAALIVGVLAAFIWLSQTDLASIGLRPEESDALPTTTVTVLPPASANLPAPAVQDESVAPAPASQADTAPTVRSSAATPTRTPTAVPYLDSTEAVVGLGGALLWNGGGSPVERLPQGALVSASQRSADGEWVFAQPEDGQAGWMAVDSLIIFDVERLAPSDVVIVPMTPTPAPPVASREIDQSGASSALPTVTALPETGFSPPDTSGKPTARIAIEDGRLNVRAGPAATYKVIAKAFADELYVMLARSGDGAWVQIDMPRVTGGFGWAAVEYLESTDDLDALPISDTVSSAPAFGTGGAESVATPTRESSGLPPMRMGPPPMSGDESSSNPPSVTGLTGKLVIQQEWGGSIYVYDLETGDLRLLTGGFDPAITPDGSQVTFTRDGGENGVYVTDIQGDAERLIFSGRQRLRSPKFSPDGQFIVFERGDESILCKDDPVRCRASVPSPDGDMPEREVQPSLARVRADGSDYWDPIDLPYARVPDWNAGGIVYQSRAGLQITQNEPNADTELVYFDILKQYEMDPDWQPGGGAIAFQQRESSHWEIFAVNPDGSGLHGLTRPQFPLAESLPSNVSPAWSPDGKHVVFLSNRTPENTAGDWGVWVMDADGTNQRRLPIELPFVYTYVSEQMVDWGP